MPTGQTIVNNALTALGLLDPTGTPSVSDSTDALGELNSMWAAWGVDDGFVWAVQPVTFAAAASIQIAPLPQRVYGAFFIDTQGTRTELGMADNQRYRSHGDLTATAKKPDELYIDFNVNPCTAYPWPVPSAGGQIELETAVTFQQWSLTVNYSLPYADQDAIQYALAWRLLPRYGAAVAQQVAEVIRELGMKAEARMIASHAANRLKPPAPPAQSAPAGPSPITTPQLGAFQGIQPNR